MLPDPDVTPSPLVAIILLSKSTLLAELWKSKYAGPATALFCVPISIELGLIRTELSVPLPNVPVPTTAKSPRNAVSPLVAPILSKVAAPAKFIVVAFLSNTSTDVCPLYNVVAFGRYKFALRMLNVPVVAPTVRAVAAPAKFTVVAVAFTKLNVVAEVVKAEAPAKKKAAPKKQQFSKKPAGIKKPAGAKKPASPKKPKSKPAA